jgi:hypothetical protein
MAESENCPNKLGQQRYSKITPRGRPQQYHFGGIFSTIREHPPAANPPFFNQFAIGKVF